MAASVFDTLSYAKRLKAAGIPEAQAEAQAEALAEAVGAGVATRQDLDTRVSELRQALSELALKMEARFTASDGRLNVVQWIAGFNLALTVTILFKMFS